MMNISRNPSHLFAATALGAVLCASFAPAHAGLLGGSASGGLTANGRVGGQLGAETRSVGPAARTISSGAERTANGLSAQGAAQGAAQSSLPGGAQGGAAASTGGGSSTLSGSAASTAPTHAVDANGDATLKTPTRAKR